MKVLLALLISCLLSFFVVQSVAENAEKELLEQISALNAEKDALLRENVEIKKSKSQLEKNIEQLTKKSSYILELGKLEEKYVQLESESNQKIHILSEHILKAEQERDTARHEAIKAASIQPNKAIEAEVVTLREKVLTLGSSLLQSENAFHACSQESSECETKLNDLKVALHRTAIERDQLHSDVRSAGGMVMKAQKETHTIKERYNVATRTILEQTNTIKELELHHDKCRGVTHQLETSLTVLQKQIGRNVFVVFKEKLGALAVKVLRWLKIVKKSEM